MIAPCARERNVRPGQPYKVRSSPCSKIATNLPGQRKIHATGFCTIELGMLKGRLSEHPGFRSGKLYRLELYKKPTIRALQMLRFLAQKMIWS